MVHASPSSFETVQCCRRLTHRTTGSGTESLGEWLRARPKEYDVADSETVNARANFLVGGRVIDSPLGKAFWNQVSLVWVHQDQLFGSAQNPNINIAGFASKMVDHFILIQGLPNIGWCINQFTNVVSGVDENGQSKMAAGQADGNLFDIIRDFYISYFNAGSNSDDSSDFYPFPFAGLGVTCDPYRQARLEALSTEAEQSAILPSPIGPSEFLDSIPKYGYSNTGTKVLDVVHPITTTVSYPVPGPLPILGVGASFAFARRLRQRIRLARRLNISLRFRPKWRISLRRFPSSTAKGS